MCKTSNSPTASNAASICMCSCHIIKNHSSDKITRFIHTVNCCRYPNGSYIKKDGTVDILKYFDVQFEYSDKKNIKKCSNDLSKTTRKNIQKRIKINNEEKSYLLLNKKVIKIGKSYFKDSNKLGGRKSKLVNINHTKRAGRLKKIPYGFLN